MTDTDEAVERAASRLWEYDNPAEPWDQALARVPVFAGQYRHKAHLALAAADGGEVERLRATVEKQERALELIKQSFDGELDRALVKLTAVVAESEAERDQYGAENERLRAVADAAPEYVRLASEIVALPTGLVTLAMASRLADAQRKLDAALAALHADKEDR